MVSKRKIKGYLLKIYEDKNFECCEYLPFVLVCYKKFLPEGQRRDQEEI